MSNPQRCSATKSQSHFIVKGKLPSLQNIAERGLLAEIQSLADCLPDAVRTTFSYGVNPGKLAKYFYVQYDHRLGRLRYARDDEMTGKPFWSYLGEAGLTMNVTTTTWLHSAACATIFCLGCENTERYFAGSWHTAPGTY